jgi:predicted alpha/beta-fold hydrolase
MAITGHLRTVLPRLGDALRPPPSPASAPWAVELQEDDRRVRLSGSLGAVDGADSLVVIVHGLGGSADSPYARRAAAGAEALGMSSLRLNLRGSDRGGDDFYHAGLTADLHAALASPEAAGYGRIYLLGVSLGGHVTLRLLCEPHDPRVRAVAAVCSPLDLDACSAAIDRPQSAIYRYYVLHRLREIYAAVAARHPVPTPVEALRSVRKLRTFDGLTVAPRWGFASAEDYYARASVGPLLPRIAKPALLVASQEDPMVPAETLHQSLRAAPAALDVRWVRGGHVGRPERLDLGCRAPLGLAGQVLGWLRER